MTTLMMMFLIACGGGATTETPAGGEAGHGDGAHGEAPKEEAPAAAAPVDVKVRATKVPEGADGEAPKLEVKIKVGDNDPITQTLQGAGEGTAGLEGSLWGVNAFWAGAGTNLRIVKDGENVVVRTQETDEAGTSEWSDVAKFPVGAAEIKVTVAE